jgi:hypothetical protein
MPSIDNTDINIRDNDGSTTPGGMQTTRYNRGDCIKRAFQRLAFFWLLAGVTLFIPIAHFVLVPGFLIAGPVIAYLTYRTTWVRNHASGRCPACDTDIRIGLDARDELPKWSYCPSCNAPLRLADAADSSYRKSSEQK